MASPFARPSDSPPFVKHSQKEKRLFLNGGSLPQTPGIYRFLADWIETGAAIAAPASPRLQQRSGRIPAEPYPLCKRL
jgi:hypothetical protein